MGITKGYGILKLPFILKKRDVGNFLETVREKLRNEGEDALLFKQNRVHEKENVKYTNQYCMEKLEYDVGDAMHEIMTLETSHYLESLNDRKNSQLDLLHVFIKEIQNQQVYIKLKMKELGDNEMVLCISFHFAEHSVDKLPYG